MPQFPRKVPRRSASNASTWQDPGKGLCVRLMCDLHAKPPVAAKTLADRIVQGRFGFAKINWADRPSMPRRATLHDTEVNAGIPYSAIGVSLGPRCQAGMTLSSSPFSLFPRYIIVRIMQCNPGTLRVPDSGRTLIHLGPVVLSKCNGDARCKNWNRITRSHPPWRNSHLARYQDSRMQDPKSRPEELEYQVAALRRQIEELRFRQPGA